MEIKCSLLIQQLIYLSYDYFKHMTKNNETRCKCFLEDFFVSVILFFQLKRVFFKYSYKTLGFCHFAALFYTLFPKKPKGNCS